MKGCGRCWTEAELELLDGDPALLSDEIVYKFAWETFDHFEPDEYELAWRRIGYRVVQVLEHHLTEPKLTQGLRWAGWSSWPEGERAALYSLFTEAVLRAAADEERWPKLNGLVQAAAQLDQSLTPWLRLVDTLPDEVVAYLVKDWSYDLYYYSGHFGTWLYWDDPTPGEEMQEWLLRPALRDRLSGMDSEAAQSALEHFRWIVGDFSTR